MPPRLRRLTATQAPERSYDPPAGASQDAAFDEKIAAGDATSQQRELGQQQLERMRVNGSRLVAVDAGADAASPRAPRYAAVVNYGARREPWVEEIVALNKGTATP